MRNGMLVVAALGLALARPAAAETAVMPQLPSPSSVVGSFRPAPQAFDAAALAPAPAIAKGAAAAAPGAAGCAGLGAELERIRQDRARLDLDAAYYLRNLSLSMELWYRNLRLYEGRVAYIPFGAFANISVSAVNVQRSGYEYEARARDLDRRLGEAVRILPGCLK